MKAVDLGKFGNPLLDHARNMNDPKVDKSVVLTHVVRAPQDVPLSEVMPVEVDEDFDNSRMIQESRLDYVSPLHKSNPKPSWTNSSSNNNNSFRGGSCLLYTSPSPRDS